MRNARRGRPRSAPPVLVALRHLPPAPRREDGPPADPHPRRHPQARRVREHGFTALKTNIFLFDGGSPELYMPGFGRSPGGPELNPSIRVEEALNKQLAAFRDGTGKDVEFLPRSQFQLQDRG